MTVHDGVGLDEGACGNIPAGVAYELCLCLGLTVGGERRDGVRMYKSSEGVRYVPPRGEVKICVAWDECGKWVARVKVRPLLEGRRAKGGGEAGSGVGLGAEGLE